MMKKNFLQIAQATIERLPLYYRILEQAAERGETLLSSNQLGEILNLNPVQIRKDLNYFGKFGMKGCGYQVEELKNAIGKILGYEYKRGIGIVGAGYLGSALANCKKFSELGFQVTALFDVDKRIIGSEIGSVKVYDFNKIDSVIMRKRIEIGVIATPENFAQKIADALVSAGVKGIWNFSQMQIVVPKEIAVRNEDLSFSLSVLNYQITQNDEL